ncbi:MAG: T9SS C-terminal target domain-containing protein, partial [Flavobacteriales bacterium]|nr:T9SS C-terminal target domain-containing protein [Flavobacteriales bacterium]
FIITRKEVEEFRAYWAAKCEGFKDDTWDDYEIPKSILEWPAHGNIAAGESWNLAPFYNNDDDCSSGSPNYDPKGDGDYPYYDFDNKECDPGCGSTSRRSVLYGDYTIWWVFNDAGNIHTETGGKPIGMEIKAQAFGFATNDEINNMTFYNYELTNRGTQTLENTYFGQWVDPDLGDHLDDFVGCDVSRGLGYCINGDGYDGGNFGYGSAPPAIGIDFFQGPYQDADFIDNPLTEDVATALATGGIPYKGIGIGYGDGCVDNERFGMRKFMYHDNDNTAQGDPELHVDYYNLMKGIWKDGTDCTYGNNGAGGSIPADYMFPGDTDPLNWGTKGVATPGAWSEETAGNLPGDRRFLQAAGPFTLEPGAVNNVTVGVVYARSLSSNPLETLKALQRADDKAQALFDNCFKLVDGPPAPELGIQEIDRELLFTIYNNSSSKNFKEDYTELDSRIPETITIDTLEVTADREYHFQGYQVFQLKDNTVSAADVANPDVSRLVFQCDKKDSVDRLINFIFDVDLGYSVPTEMVDAANEGIGHSFKLRTDLFSQGDTRLVNHKRYYYMAIAYAYNGFKEYDPLNGNNLDGQKLPYLAGRLNGQGTEIKTMIGIPHIPAPELMGTIANANFGDGVEITRLEGKGNAGSYLEITKASEAEIVANFQMEELTYKAGLGPIKIKVIDPLNVKPGQFQIRLFPDSNSTLNDASWELYDLVTNDTIRSDQSIMVVNEQLLPEYGISIEIENRAWIHVKSNNYTQHIIGSALIFADSSKRWLTHMEDNDALIWENWIRAGVNPDPTLQVGGDVIVGPSTDRAPVDPDEEFETLINGGWAPYRLVGDTTYQPADRGMRVARNMIKNGIQKVESIDVVFTKDRSKWTKCVVFEMGEDAILNIQNADKFDVRPVQSVDKYGDPASGTGMGWFPGYAIDVETGERLNMAFGEDSWLGSNNGSDMKWNPTSNKYNGMGQPIYGGKHYVYVFKNDRREEFNPTKLLDRQPYYDEGQWIRSQLTAPAMSNEINVWSSCIWVGTPMLVEEAKMLSYADGLIPTETRVQLRVEKAYAEYAIDGSHIHDSGDLVNSANAWNPLYNFSTDAAATSLSVDTTAVSALDIIRAVPNPYLAYSSYESSKLDNRMKVTNLPDQCTVTIYNTAGRLIKTIRKDNLITSVDWDLKNEKGIPIASGCYIIHINAPGIGEKVIKWYGVIREVNLDKY